MTYSSTMALGRQNIAMRGQNSVSFRPKDTRLGPVSNTIVLIVLVCLLGLLYLTQVTKTNTYGYMLNNLSEEGTSLQKEHDDLATVSDNARQLSKVKQSAEAKALVAVAPSGDVR